MPGGSCSSFAELPRQAAAVVHEARRGILSTVTPEGEAHSVPICFALRAEEVVSAIDDKPKTGKDLKRVRNLQANASASVLFDRWDEDWTRLGWVMAMGAGRVEERGDAWERLLERYPQYEEMAPATRAIVVRPEKILWWSWE